jgi:chemosensory pili system protein ChpA (sensor histidine kinase/response regulator)
MIDPLLHLLRNCVDHGVERDDERRSAGKPETGRIFIHAFYQGTQVVIQVGDDGRGIEPERLRTAAVRGGFLSPADAADADLEGLHQLLFVPGFSTAGEVSEISGRGVGLDIVRSRVAKLKGSIAVDSTVGKGTTFSIRLPMTLAIVRSLLVSAHGKTFAIPIQAVSQIIRVEKSAIGKVADGRVIFHGGRVFSLFQLGKTLALPTLTEEEPAVMPVLITYAGSREVAVQVDKIVAAREIVVKTLGTHLRRVHGMIGATVMGDGAVVPILNLPELVESMKVMIVDDSVSVRRVVSTMIKSQGWTPIQAKDGLDAFEQLQRSATPPDAILLDVEMPRMSGYELLATLRSQEKFTGVPIVMVTSRAGEKHRRKAMELGANEYTVKPFLEDALVSLLRKLVAAPAAMA